eukprot:3234439-Alexandrium_andersonii.AAC.1
MFGVGRRRKSARSSRSLVALGHVHGECDAGCCGRGAWRMRADIVANRVYAAVVLQKPVWLKMKKPKWANRGKVVDTGPSWAARARKPNLLKRHRTTPGKRAWSLASLASVLSAALLPEWWVQRVVEAAHRSAH